MTRSGVEVDYRELASEHAEIWMKVRATKQQVAAVRKALRDEPNVDEFAFLDKHDAYQEFKRIFRDDPKLVKNVDPAALPTSFRIVLRDVAEASPGLTADWHRLHGVDDIAESPLLREAFTRRQEACNHPVVDLEVFLRVNATADDERRAGDALAALPGIAHLDFVTRDDAAAFVNCYFVGSQIFDGLSADRLPPSFRITVERGANEQALAKSIAMIPGVDDVRGLP